MISLMRLVTGALLVVLLMPDALKGQALDPMNSLRNPRTGGSSNIHVQAHLTMGGAVHTSDVEIEQELSRPYVYVGRVDIGGEGFAGPSKGIDIVSVADPTRPKVIYSWRIEDQELHRHGAMDNKYFKLDGRYYVAQSFQFRAGGPNVDLGAVLLDVTSLPDTTGIREVARIRAPDTPGGFHNIYAYKHSDGRALLFTTTSGEWANVYDMAGTLGGDARSGLISRIPNPKPGERFRGYHDFYVGYDPATRQDKFYGAGLNGYYLYDVTEPEEPSLITSITGAPGIFIAHTMTPDPTGRYVVTEVEYQYTPLRIYDLKPGLDGEVETISRPVGAWLATWDGNAHNHEVRWPYVFVSGYMDGLQVFNMMDPTNPYTVGHHHTCDCFLPAGAAGAGLVGGMGGGAWGVDVRNADGLIIVGDAGTALWTFRMDGFDGWNGHQWGMPDISSAQDWDNGPDGAPRPGVS